MRKFSLPASGLLLCTLAVAGAFGCQDDEVSASCLDVTGSYTGKDSDGKNVEATLEQTGCSELKILSESGTMQLSILKMTEATEVWKAGTQCADQGNGYESCGTIAFEEKEISVTLFWKIAGIEQEADSTASLSLNSAGDLVATINIRNQSGAFDTESLTFKRQP